MTAPTSAVDALLAQLDETRAKATPIPDLPGYGASGDGRIWSLNSNWRQADVVLDKSQVVALRDALSSWLAEGEGWE